MQTNELLEALNQAIADTPWWLPNAPALELVGRREVLGQLGNMKDPGELGVIGGPGLGTTGDPDAPIEGRRIYVFTRSQCKKMRKVIRAAAEDATRP